MVITGASGNVGTALLRKLIAAEPTSELIGIARRQPPPVDVYRHVKWHQLDLADRGAVTTLQRLFRRADCVVHLAWGFQPTRNTRYLDAVGIGGTNAVLMAAHAAHVGHLIHMSSVGAYSTGRYGQYVDEWWPTEGLSTSAYSRAKAAAEKMLDDYEVGGDGVPLARIRPALIVQRDAAAALRRYAFPAYIDPRWLRLLPVFPLDRSLCLPLVHADDVAEACLRVIERRAQGPYNISAEPPVRRDDIARVLGAAPLHVPAQMLRPLVRLSWLARLQPVDPGWLDLAFSVPLLNCDRARIVLDWRPQRSSLEALTDVGRGFLDHEGTPSPVLCNRSLVDSVWRELSDGPITTRRVP
ncbi:MAG: NAD-dependent epimerase/dehydratase family protein [Mycobacteriaceae bacterium]|nr:NAD-dependent epimerase/dehydratase family protein [Mycobacteriaceae bacterium]